MRESGATPVENVRRRSGPLKVVGVGEGGLSGRSLLAGGDRPASRWNGRESRAVQSGACRRVGARPTAANRSAPSKVSVGAYFVNAGKRCLGVLVAYLGKRWQAR